ncbi:MAG TPA: kelch repeat-containing protein [Verrucomicrobiota bacterium]|nr:kelch repeat-containing protein [Verrucomicrobiota bacterium]
MHLCRHLLCVVAVVCPAVFPPTVSAQSNAVVSIEDSFCGVEVSWNGVGTLQSAPTSGGFWREILEAGNPFCTTALDEQRFFRVINRWATRANLLTNNSEMGVAELDGKIYVLGGYPPSRVTQRTVQVYDTQTDSWSYTTPLPIPLNHPMPAVANGKLYMIGGQTTDSGTGSFTNTVFEFDPATTNWVARAPMPTSRSAGVAAVIGNLIYVAGGRPPRGQDFAVYNVTSNSWQTLPNLPTGRNHLAACALGGRVYVAGGRLGGGFTSPMTNVLEVFDSASNQWSSAAPMPFARGGINGIEADGCFFVFGGEGPSGMGGEVVFGDMLMYVPGEDRWYQLQKLPVPVHGVTGAAYVNGWIHLTGGGVNTGGSSGSTIHQVFWLDGLVP